MYRPTWKGRCRSCLPGVGKGLGNLIIEDVTVYDWPNQPGGSPGPAVAEILFSQRVIEKGVPVSKCGVPIKYLLCGHTRTLSRESAQVLISRHSVGRRRFPQYCRECFRNPYALLRVLQGNVTGNGNGQKNEIAKKKRPGPEKGFNAKITEEKVREAFSALGRYAPQEKVAEVIGVDARSLRDWHKARGLTYKQFQQQFTSTGGS